jgi:hypothetical protein
MLLLYTLANSAMLVVGRTRYQWGNVIHPRFAAQFSWILIATVAASLPYAIPKRLGSIVMVVATCGMLIARVESIRQEPISASVAIPTNIELIEQIRRWSAQGRLIVSNDGPLLTTLTGIGVRKIYSYSRFSPDRPPASYAVPLQSLLNDCEALRLGIVAVLVGVPEKYVRETRDAIDRQMMFSAVTTNVVIFQKDPGNGRCRE